jgi:DNA modification methylase
MATFRIIEGDALVGLRSLQDKSAQTCVTSPPYFGLRDYGAEGQIGLEGTPELYVARLVEVFREVWRVLRDDGTVFLNLGDSYASQGGSGKQGATGQRADRTFTLTREGGTRPPAGYKPKDLLGIPWMVAFALRADGWYLRQEIIWHKPNPMPESVTDRCTKAHEQIFLLSKRPRYYFDSDAIREPAKDSSIARLGRAVSDEHKNVDGAPGQPSHAIHKPRLNVKFGGNNRCPDTRLQSGNDWVPKERPQRRRAIELAEAAGLTEQHFAAIRAVGITDTGKAQVTQDGFGKNDVRMIELAAEAKAALGGYYREFLFDESANKKSVWAVPTKGFKGAHFAVFPLELITPCVLAGSKEGDTVLDPFTGSGTTGVVALRHNRNFVGCELNADYVRMARERIYTDAPMFNREDAA